jgi:GNAT superfamily N-acetyltransferase
MNAIGQWNTSAAADVPALPEHFPEAIRLESPPDARGTGIGRALIEAVYARAKAAGSERVYWQTHETNAIAQRLYDRIAVRSGFIVYRHDI